MNQLCNKLETITFCGKRAETILHIIFQLLYDTQKPVYLMSDNKKIQIKNGGCKESGNTVRRGERSRIEKKEAVVIHLSSSHNSDYQFNTDTN